MSESSQSVRAELVEGLRWFRPSPQPSPARGGGVWRLYSGIWVNRPLALMDKALEAINLRVVASAPWLRQAQPERGDGGG